MRSCYEKKLRSVVVGGSELVDYLSIPLAMILPAFVLLVAMGYAYIFPLLASG
jgi:hypothetical protein